MIEMYIERYNVKRKSKLFTIDSDHVSLHIRSQDARKAPEAKTLILRPQSLLWTKI